MPDDAKLRVRIELDDKDFRKKVKDLRGKSVKATPGADSNDSFSSLLKSKLFSKGSPLEKMGSAFENIKGAIGAGASGAGGAGAAIGGAVGGLAGGIAGMVIVKLLEMVVQGITAVVGLLSEASGILKNAIGNTLKAIMFILKPIGDIIGSALQPLIWIMMPMAKMINLLFKPFLLSYRKRLLEEKQKGSFDMFSGNFDPFGASIRSSLSALGDWGGFLMTTGLEQLLLGLTDAIAGLGTAIVQNTMDAIIVLLNLMKMVVSPILGAVDALLGFIGINTTFRKDFEKSIDTMIVGVDAMKTNIINGIEVWRVNTRENIISAFDLMEKLFAEGLGALVEQVKAYKNAVTNVPSSSGGYPTGDAFRRALSQVIIPTDPRLQTPERAAMFQVGSSYVPETGMYTLHRGEQVLRANEQTGAPVNITNSITLNAKVNNKMDLRKLADELSEILTTNMQSELRRRVSYI